jgi:pyruvate dehydrogenase E1 component alpha subunit
VLLEHRLREGGAVDDAAVEKIAGHAQDEVAAAVEFADASEPPPIEDLYTDVYAGADEYLGKPPELMEEEGL